MPMYEVELYERASRETSIVPVVCRSKEAAGRFARLNYPGTTIRSILAVEADKVDVPIGEDGISARGSLIAIVVLFGLIIFGWKTCSSDDGRSQSHAESADQQPADAKEIVMDPVAPSQGVLHMPEANVDPEAEPIQRKSIYSGEHAMQSPTAAQAPRLLRTYFVLVRRDDERIETLEISAQNEAQARQVLRDFRGDPVIVDGPSLEQSW